MTEKLKYGQRVVTPCGRRARVVKLDGDKVVCQILGRNTDLCTTVRPSDLWLIDSETAQKEQP